MARSMHGYSNPTLYSMCVLTRGVDGAGEVRSEGAGGPGPRKGRRRPTHGPRHRRQRRRRQRTSPANSAAARNVKGEAVDREVLEEHARDEA